MSLVVRGGIRTQVSSAMRMKSFSHTFLALPVLPKIDLQTGATGDNLNLRTNWRQFGTLL